jgi:hypothetical protein
VLANVAQWLKPGGCMIIVEYDVKKPGPWVPHPVPFDRLAEIAPCAGLSAPRLLGRRPSRYHGPGVNGDGGMYSALLAGR